MTQPFHVRVFMVAPSGEALGEYVYPPDPDNNITLDQWLEQEESQGYELELMEPLQNSNSNKLMVVTKRGAKPTTLPSLTTLYCSRPDEPPPPQD